MTVFRPGRRAAYVARWTDPETGRRRERSLAARTQRDAYQAAANLARKVLAGVSPDDPGWDAFCRLYEEGHVSRQSRGHRQNWRTLRWSVESHGAASLSAITAAWILRWQQGLRARGLAANTVAAYSARLRAALRWAVKHDLLIRVPHIAVEVAETPASRGTTGEEHERILAAVPKVRPDDAPQWTRLLRGLAACNLRIGELAALSWEPDAPIRIDQRGRYPLVRMAPQAVKSRSARIQPITPEFWALCCETPPGARAGPVFPLANGRGGQMSRKRIIRIISQIGEKAGVVTNPDKPKKSDPSKRKTATSHDIGRRSFVPKVDAKLTALEVHKWMGHKKFDTTLTFYDTRDAEDLAAKLWTQVPTGPAAAATAPPPSTYQPAP